MLHPDCCVTKPSPMLMVSQDPQRCRSAAEAGAAEPLAYAEVALLSYDHLLNMGGQLGESLCVGQDGTGTIAQETDIPDGSQAQLHRNVFLKRSVPEVLVYIPCTCRPRGDKGSGTVCCAGKGSSEQVQRGSLYSMSDKAGCEMQRRACQGDSG